MNTAQIVILGIIQGFAELLPVSSSAHVILAERLMGLDPSKPEMTFLLVMLHTGTMFAVLLYFFSRWRSLFTAIESRATIIRALVVATLSTAALGVSLKVLIEKVFLERIFGYPKGEIEQLFRVWPLMALSLSVAGVLIVITGTRKQKSPGSNLNFRSSLIIGLAQGFCLPFRGLSRSGTTISAAMLLDVPAQLAEEFSFALAIVLTPAAIAIELRRLFANSGSEADLGSLLMPGIEGMVISFIAGLLALKWLSAWLKKGYWRHFGYYCLLLSIAIVIANLY